MRQYEKRSLIFSMVLWWETRVSLKVHFNDFSIPNLPSCRNPKHCWRRPSLDASKPRYLLVGVHYFWQSFASVLAYTWSFTQWECMMSWARLYKYSLNRWVCLVLSSQRALRLLSEIWYDDRFCITILIIKLRSYLFSFEGVLGAFFFCIIDVRKYDE